MKHEPAFPLSSDEGYRNTGLTLRDYFAAKAMNGLIMNTAIADKKLAIMQREYWLKTYGNVTEFEAIAKESWLMADAMLKAREQ